MAGRKSTRRPISEYLTTSRKGASVISLLARIRHIWLAGSPIAACLETPAPGHVVAGAIDVAGWTFAKDAAITRVQAAVGAAPFVTVRHGVDRPDVVAALGPRTPLASGFRGQVPLGPGGDAPAVLRVQCIDERGRIRELNRTVSVRPALCEIERAECDDCGFDVEGWIAWPGSTPARSLSLFVGETLLGQTPVNRSRPDIHRRSLTQPIGSLRGFRVFGSLNSIGTQGALTMPLTIECVDGQGRRFRQLTGAVLRRRPSRATAAALRAIEEAIAQVRDRLNRDPSILDWHTHLPLADMFPQSTIFSPPDPRSVSLPYLDRTVDIVVVSGDDARRTDEARRVATMAVLLPRAEPAEDASVSAATLTWLQPDGASSPSSESASIIIPAYNQAAHTEACLTQVVATLPRGFRGEILVVDDGSTDHTPAMLNRWAASNPLVRILRNDANVGFVHACNRGAEAATGDILVFLNNDTLPQSGWLPPLFASLQEFPSAGAVGGKLLYPDGSLQEAGAVIFADGSGCNFGSRDPLPNAPLYTFARQVDYCSGALLAIRRDLFLEMGGFDTRFAPAYYEDVDLCFRLRARGLRVYYQPDTVVVHAEGATSGTDPNAGVKRYQAINREKFVERWREELTAQPARPVAIDAAARSSLSTRPGQPRALVVAPLMPEYDREGGSQRVMHLIEFLREAGWAVSFLALNATGGVRYGRLLRQRGVASYAGPDSLFAEDDYLEDIDVLLGQGQFDLAILAFWETGEALLPRLRSLCPNTCVIIDSIDLHFLRSARGILHQSAGHVRGTLGPEFADRMTRELNVYASADLVLTVSQKEADLVNALGGARNLAHCVPLMEDMVCSPIAEVDRQGLLFIGNFRHAPNLEGLKHFCHSVLPLLDARTRAAHPLFVVGNDLSDTVRAAVAGVDHVRLVGWVPALAPYLARARVSVIPLLHGAGTKTKLIQALMAGTPSVSTTIGVEGLSIEAGRDVLVADTPEAFAVAIERLVQDSDLWNRIAADGRVRIAESHSPAVVRSRFHSVVARVMKKLRR